MTFIEALAWLAEPATGTTTTKVMSIEGIFLQYGLIGAVALILGFFARNTIKATEARAARLEEDNRRLYSLMAEQMIPALTKATGAVSDATAVMSDLRKQAEIAAAVEASRRLREG